MTEFGAMLVGSGICFRSFRQTVRELGWFNTVFYSVHRALIKLGGVGSLHRYYLMAQPIPETDILPPQRGRSITVEQTVPDVESDDLPLSAEDVDKRAARGDICFSAFVDGKAVGYMWLCFGTFDETEVHCRFVPMPQGETVWDFDIFIRPEFRIGFVFGRLWDEANRFLRGRSVSWTVSRISAYNARSLASHGNLDARKVGTAVFLTIGHWQLILATLPPRLNLRTGNGKVPEITITPPGTATIETKDLS